MPSAVAIPNLNPHPETLTLRLSAETLTPRDPHPEILTPRRESETLTPRYLLTPPPRSSLRDPHPTKVLTYSVYYRCG